MKQDKMAKDKVTELLLQALETEIGGVEVYRTALKCVQNEDLREEWEKYLGRDERAQADPDRRLHRPRRRPQRGDAAAVRSSVTSASRS